jgi:DNA repair exonuclease SbcCD ATPase subunit
LNGSPRHVDRLYAVPLEDFVAERKQLAKELRAGGDREAAAEVAKLPKPTPPAWALNQFAREEPDAVAEWLDAAEALREASAAPGPGLRETMAEHRDATRRLLAAVRERTRPGGRPLSETMLERVRELLQAATADPEQAEALRHGTIVEGGEPPALPAAGERAGTPEVERAAPRTSSRAAKEREAERKAKEQAERLAELERHVRAAEEELARLREEAGEREAAAAEADEHLDDARRALHRTESEASAAHAAADDARSAAATAERELRQLTRQLRNASS